MPKPKVNYSKIQQTKKKVDKWKNTSHVGIIREAIQNGHTLVSIGNYFKTTKGTIWKIKAGYSWQSA